MGYLIKDSYFNSYYNNSFVIYYSIINDRLYLIYTNKNKSIILFDIIDKRKVCEIRNAHNYDITDIRYYLDKRLKRDLILTLSNNDCNIKIWCFNYIGCLSSIGRVIQLGMSNSSNSCCLLYDNNEVFVVISNFNSYSDGRGDSIKIVSFNEKIYKTMNDSSYSTSFIDVYYDNKLFKNFIIAGNKGFVKSYDYEINQVYHTYKYDDKRYHHNIIINNNKEMTQLIETSDFGAIRIWNFHSGELLEKINFYEGELCSICLWDNNYLLIGCKFGKIKIININEKLINEFDACKSDVINIKKIYHSKYGECLISQGTGKDSIKIWVIKNNNNESKE